MSAVFCRVHRFYPGSVVSEFRTVALFFAIFLVTACGSDLTVSASPPQTAPGPAWHLVWQDHFNGTSIDTNLWHVYSKTKGWGLEKYRPSQVTVRNSICTFTAVKEGADYWSGGLTNTGKKGVISYGYYELRCKLPAFTGGQWPAFWLVGCNGQWHPEFDIFDGTVGPKNNQHGNNCYTNGVHWANAMGRDQSWVDFACPEGGNITGDFHTYGFLWTKDSCCWYFDDKRINKWIPNQFITDCPNPIILNFEMGGWGGGSIVDSTLPWIMQIDWVRVWKIEPSVTSHSTNSLQQHSILRLSHRALSISHQVSYLETWLMCMGASWLSWPLIERRFRSRIPSGDKPDRFCQLLTRGNMTGDRIVLKN